jgi:hypothetical protein
MEIHSQVSDQLSFVKQCREIHYANISLQGHVIKGNKVFAHVKSGIEILLG